MVSKETPIVTDNATNHNLNTVGGLCNNRASKDLGENSNSPAGIFINQDKKSMENEEENRDWNNLKRKCSPEDLDLSAAIMWGIWKNRNALVWNNSSLSPVKVVESTMNCLAEWRLANKDSVVPRALASGQVVKWAKPPLGGNGTRVIVVEVSCLSTCPSTVIDRLSAMSKKKAERTLDEELQNYRKFIRTENRQNSWTLVKGELRISDHP
ncbi:hypothetical protein LguiB_005908 [Lonicera macranthoides]